MEGNHGLFTPVATTDSAFANYKQCDPSWDCFPYTGSKGDCTTTHCNRTEGGGDRNNICASGCGITSSAMVLSYLRRSPSNFTSLKPPDIGKYFVNEGYRNSPGGPAGSTCDGVSQIAICAAASHWGFSCVNFTNATLGQKLGSEGKPLIAHVRAKGTPNTCKFTSGGHYIVLKSFNVTKGAFEVNDPDSSATSRSTGTVKELVEDCSFVGFVYMYLATDADRMVAHVANDSRKKIQQHV
jgi:hypothetical protein